MSLDALAPDQRAVVQLVLQQDRSYDELAGLLGISADAVRERALKGLARLAPADELTPEEVGDVSDYLLGQQSVSGRETTRALLASSAPARMWARAVAGELEDVARTPLPGVPGGEAPAEAVAADALEPELEPDAAAAAPDPAGEPTVERPVRARPRPRPRDDRDRDRAAAGAATAGAARGDRGDRPRSNRLGGALIIGALGLILAAALVWLVTRDGDDDPGGSTKASGTSSADATPTPSATSEFQPLGQLSLKSPTGGKAKGQMVIFASQSGGIAFTIQATGVPASGEGEAYAVWLTGGGDPHRLGFAPQVKSDGKLGTSGPRDQDATDFAKWFASARRVVVSKETSEDTSKPGPVVLEGTVPRGTGSGSSGG
jgi:Sigma-70, region 4